MKLYTSTRAPNPRRVLMFMAEKGIADITTVQIDLGKAEHRSEAFMALNPMAQVPVLELDDGRTLAETRAICTYLEGRFPHPNLMGEGFEERAFIEMMDRRCELQLFLRIANCVRHTHPGLAALEQPQFGDFGAAQGAKVSESARWLAAIAARPAVQKGILMPASERDLEKASAQDAEAFAAQVRAMLETGQSKEVS